MQNYGSIMLLVLMVAVMYFLLIRPQKKRDKEVNTMRSNIKAGDEIVTIGGIFGTVVRVKDEQLVIQVGSDKTKIEIARWAVSKVLNADPAAAKAKKPAAAQEEETAKKARPKKLEKTSTVEEPVAAVAEEPVAEQVEAPVTEEATTDSLDQEK